MKILDLLAHRLRGSEQVHESRAAALHSEKVIERVERQEPEARRHAAFARLVMAENHLAPKIRHAMRETK